MSRAVRVSFITKEQRKSIDNWIKKHVQICPILSNPATQNWPGSSFHYVFTRCSFRNSISSIKCNCGVEFNVPFDSNLI